MLVLVIFWLFKQFIRLTLRYIQIFNSIINVNPTETPINNPIIKHPPNYRKYSPNNHQPWNCLNQPIISINRYLLYKIAKIKYNTFEKYIRNKQVSVITFIELTFVGLLLHWDSKRDKFVTYFTYNINA